MKKPKILVVGSFVMDQIASTSVFPRQGQTVLGNSFRKAPGGKGANQAVQMARLGADVTMLGKLGRDANGQEMRRVCEEAGIHTEHILYDETHASGCAVIILEENPDGSAQNRILVIPGANMTLTPEDVSFLSEDIVQYDMVVLQLEIPMAVNLAVAQAAHAHGVPVMLNSAPSAPLPPQLLQCLTYISPNEHEAEDLTGIHIRHDGATFSREDVAAAANALHSFGIQTVLITLGSAGAALSTGKELLFAPCAENIQAVDPTAAGDSFVGAFCTGVCCGWDMSDVLLFANHTAALTVSALGAMPSLPLLSAVEDFLKARTGRTVDTSALREGDL